jgi:Surface lipoprotein assembly modifier
MFTFTTSRILAAALIFAPILPTFAQEVEQEFAPSLVAAEATDATEVGLEGVADADEALLAAGGVTGLEDSPGGFSLFPGLKVDLISSASYIYDSNTTQSPVADSASLFAFGFGAITKAGKETDRGGYYGLDYNGQAFLYTDSSDDFGRDPYEQFFSGYAGVNGGKTRIRVDVNYHRNNGNSIQWDRIERETRRAASHDYGVNLGVSRDLFRGDLNFGFGYNLRDFDAGTGFGDGENVFGDLSWMTSPSFAPKSSVGLGVRFGTDEYDGSPSQEFTTPSFRWNYRVSGKTSLNSSVGYEFRSIDSPGSVDSEALVYNGGINWAATSKTGFNLGYYRNVRPSYVLNGEDSTNTGVTLAMNNNLPGLFELSSRIGYESADYSATTAVVPAGTVRDDDFLRLSLELSHPLMITERLRGQWALFYNFNQNDSTLPVYEFDQNITGIRFSLVY